MAETASEGRENITRSRPVGVREGAQVHPGRERTGSGRVMSAAAMLVWDVLQRRRCLRRSARPPAIIRTSRRSFPIISNVRRLARRTGMEMEREREERRCGAVSVVHNRLLDDDERRVCLPPACPAQSEAFDPAAMMCSSRINIRTLRAHSHSFCATAAAESTAAAPL